MYKFFTSDLHFGHANVIKYCNRPYRTAEEMDEDLISKWNSVVSPQDEVYHLGDFAFLKDEKIKLIVPRLNGKIHGIWGNHDKGKNLVGAGFVSMYQTAELRLAKDITVKMCHFPYQGDHDDYDRYPHLRPKKEDDGKWLLCGHIHEKWKVRHDMQMINVGTDVWGYKPVSADTIIDIIRKAT